MKDKFINFRSSEKEIKQLENLAKRAKMSKSDFIRHSIFSKEIVIIDGLKPLQKELKAIGNNLNQLTTRANMGQILVVDLHETKSKLGEIYDKIAEICRQKNVELLPEMKNTDEENSGKIEVENEHLPIADAPKKCDSFADEVTKNETVNPLFERRSNSIFWGNGGEKE